MITRPCSGCSKNSYPSGISSTGPPLLRHVIVWLARFGLAPAQVISVPFAIDVFDLHLRNPVVPVANPGLYFTQSATRLLVAAFQIERHRQGLREPKRQGRQRLAGSRLGVVPRLGQRAPPIVAFAWLQWRSPPQNIPVIKERTMNNREHEGDALRRGAERFPKTATGTDSSACSHQRPHSTPACVA